MQKRIKKYPKREVSQSKKKQLKSRDSKIKIVNFKAFIEVQEPNYINLG